MTTEVLRNMIYARSRRSTTSATSCSTRCTTSRTSTGGRSGRRSSSTSRTSVRLVCLSATVSNADELADWLSTVRGPTDVVVEATPTRRARELLSRRGPLRETTWRSYRRWSTADPTLAPSDSTRIPGHRGRGGGRRRYATPGRLDVVELLEQRADVAGHLLHLQSRRVRRRGSLVRAVGCSAHDRRGARSHPRDRRSTRASALRRRPRDPRSRPVARQPRGRLRRAPRRAWCRRSRKRSRPASSKVSSRSCSRPRRWRSVSTCRRGAW